MSLLGCGADPRPTEATPTDSRVDPEPGDDATDARVDPEPDDDAEAAPDPRRAALARLARWEDQRRASTDFAAVRPWSEISGPNPFALMRLPDGTGLGMLRGAGRLVRIDARGTEHAHTPTAVDATDWAVRGDELLVVGPRRGRVLRYRMPEGADDAPEPLGGFELRGVRSLRSVAVGPEGRLALGDPFDHRVLLVDPPAAEEDSVEPVWSAECGGPIDVRFVPGRLLALCMLDHSVRAWALDGSGRPHGEPVSITHDGPIWSMDARVLPGAAPDEDPPALRLVLGGVEDHPLDRSDGAFGYIDSFAFVVDLFASGEPVRRAALNLSEHGAITPKWVRLELDPDGSTLVDAIGFGGSTWVRARFGDELRSPRITTRTLVPGITDAVIDEDGSGLAADPLLDAWVAWDDDGVRVMGKADARPVDLRLGEALALTGLMAQRGSSEGRRSRFTCETCHFEGSVDGRTHYTGRDQVHATTRSLRGLFPNRPHFSRALDRTMAAMADNEFRVVNRGTDGEPWSSRAPEGEHEWLRHLGMTTPAGPEDQRRALMTFLMAYAPEPNPAATETEPDDALMRGAEAFERHCERCHAARLVADDPSSRVPPERWLAHVREGGAIVWGADQRMRTGVEPLVHEQGARVPSLRRLHAKRPYFTNGSAASLHEVLRRFTPADGMHEGGEGKSLPEDDRQALLTFLRRL